MHYVEIIKDKEFENARLILYSLLVIWYIVLTNFIHIQCPGCPLCGMTRAVKNLLILDFTKAFEFNQNVWIFIILIPIIFSVIPRFLLNS